MTLENAITEAYEVGMSDYLRGVKLDNCPYLLNERCAESWRAGWKVADMKAHMVGGQKRRMQ